MHRGVYIADTTEGDSNNVRTETLGNTRRLNYSVEHQLSQADECPLSKALLGIEMIGARS
jgi:hypothetical protein